MVFKRRDPRSFLRILAEALYPRGGWVRAFHYVRHRIRRLPDSPDRIARGIWAGVLTTFTPFYGFHFFTAALIAFVMRGNILAAVMATFFGNPATYLPIGLISLETGHWLLGTHFDHEARRTFGDKFVHAGIELKNNFFAMFTDATVDWSGWKIFYHEIFFPYMIGGLIPGVIAGTIAYLIALPLIAAYQKRRREKIKAKFEAIRRKAEAEAETEKATPKTAPEPLAGKRKSSTG